MDLLTNIISLGLAFAVVPALFIALCVRMARRKVHRFCYPAYFFLFGIVGGLCLAIALAPSGLAAACMVFLMTLAPLACLGASACLNFLKSRGRFENVAMILGYVYSGLIFTGFLGGSLFSHS
jgi:hypothetical protein